MTTGLECSFIMSTVLLNLFTVTIKLTAVTDGSLTDYSKFHRVQWHLAICHSNQYFTGIIELYSPWIYFTVLASLKTSS